MQGIVDTVQRLITKGLTLILRDSVKVAIDFFIIVGIIYTPFGAEIVTKVVTTLRRVVWFRPPGFLIAAASALNANPSRREDSAVTIGFCIDSEKVSRHSIMPMVFRHGRFKHGLVTNPSKLLCVIWQMRSWVARELGCRSTAALLKLIEGDGGDKVEQLKFKVWKVSKGVTGVKVRVNGTVMDWADFVKFAFDITPRRLNQLLDIEDAPTQPKPKTKERVGTPRNRFWLYRSCTASFWTKGCEHCGD